MKKKDRRKQDRAVGEDRRGLQRRAHERVLVDVQVNYRSDDNFLFAYITDMSAMGIFVLTQTPHPPGTRLNLQFRPDGEPAIDVEGQVVWINAYRPGASDNSNPGMGIQFVDLDPETRQRIGKLVRTIAYLDDDEATLGNS